MCLLMVNETNDLQRVVRSKGIGIKRSSREIKLISDPNSLEV